MKDQLGEFSSETGPQYFSGNNAGYSIHEALMAVQRDFIALDKQGSDVVHFYGGKRQNWISKYLGEYISTWLFGGAMFLLGESRHFRSDKG